MKVWLDDVRPKPPEFDVWIKNAERAIQLLRIGGITHISLDHDLGDGKKTGYDVARFIEESAHNKTLAPLRVSVHTDNPVGRKNMAAALTRAMEFWQNHESV